MPSGVKLPSVHQVLELAAHFGMEMTVEEAETYRAHIDDLSHTVKPSYS